MPEKTPEELRQDLGTEIDQQIHIAKTWASKNFLIAQTFTWLAVLASFGSAIAAATEKVNSILLAIFAAVPGTVILIDKSFSFARRASWYYMKRAKVQQLRNSLSFEGAQTADVSQKFSELTIKLEEEFPPMDTTGLTPGHK